MGNTEKECPVPAHMRLMEQLYMEIELSKYHGEDGMRRVRKGQWSLEEFRLRQAGICRCGNLRMVRSGLIYLPGNSSEFQKRILKTEREGNRSCECACSVQRQQKKKQECFQLECPLPACLPCRPRIKGTLHSTQGLCVNHKGWHILPGEEAASALFESLF